MLAGHAAASSATALTCIVHEDVVRAAEEALAGDHPLWADSYVIGRVEAIDREGPAVRLRLAPTHVFDGDPSEPFEIAVRPDGPPDPSTWAVGQLYFVALSAGPEEDGTGTHVAPCAPNFWITDAEQLDRLLRAAPTLTVLEPVALGPTARPDALPLIAASLGIGVIAVVSWLVFRAGRRRSAVR